MRNWFGIGAVALGLCIGGCDEDEKDPAPVGNSSGNEPGGGKGGKGDTGGPSDGDDDDDDDDDDGPGDGGNPGDGGPGDGGGAWAVGEGAEMLRLDADGASGYDLDGDADLLAIACHGDQVAWAVGGDGTVIYTHDGGDSWSPAPLSLDVTMRAVAISESHVVFLAGDEGTVLVSRDAGARFDSLGAPPADFTAVTSDAQGEYAFLTAFDGSIWRYASGEVALDRVYAGEVPLHAIASTGQADRIVAVGDGGTWIESGDLGNSWQAYDAGTARDLHAVQVASASPLALAVGEAGTSVRWDELGPAVTQLLDEDTHLRALHISAEGHGIAVGDAGVAFTTGDIGQSWTPIGAPTTHDLFGVDEISLHGHL